MDFQTTQIQINRDKRIGKVLFIVEGEKTEPFILCRIFEKVFGYHYTRIERSGKIYDKLSSDTDKNSQVVVINAEESNIDNIADENEYLNTIFENLISDYDINFKNAAIFYVWDRDCHSNTNVALIKKLLSSLGNSRDSDNFDRQGLLLLSYPCVEAYTASNFEDSIGTAFDCCIDTGNSLKQHLHSKKINHSKINENTIQGATIALLKALQEIDCINYDLDNMGSTNIRVFDYEENYYSNNQVYRLLSMLSFALLDLGLLSVID